MRRVVLAALLAAALPACGADQVVQQAEPSAAASTSVVPSPSPSASPSPEAALSAEAVVVELLQSLGAGSERAWELLTERSQQGFGSYAAFEDLQTEYAEGLAAFSSATPSTLDLGDGLSVVTLSGEVTREGVTETDAVALPVREQDGRRRVELAAPRLPVGVAVEVPESDQVVSAGSELRATVPAQSTATVVVDGEVQQARSEPSDGDRMLVTSSPQLSPGPHVLTVVAVRADGLADADAVAFRVS